MRILRRWMGRGAVGALLFLPSVAWAHERWFVSPEQVGAPSPFFSTFHWSQLVAALAVAAVLLGARSLDILLRSFRFAGGMTRMSLRLAPWMPTLVGITTGITLAIVALGRGVIAPQLVVPDTTLGTAIIIVSLVAAMAMVLGFGTRLAAVVLIGLVVWGVAHFGLPGVDNIGYLGIGAFLLVWGRGRLSLGSIFSQIMFALDTAHIKPVALSVLRILIGAALLWGAADKFLHPELHFALLDAFPNNPYTTIQLLLPSMSRDIYLLLMVAGEGALGLLLMTGWLLRAVAGLLAVTFLAFTFWFGLTDLVGHLPYIAVSLTLVVLGKSVERQERLL